MNDADAKALVDLLCDRSPDERAAWFEEHPHDDAFRTRVLRVLTHVDELISDADALADPVANVADTLATDGLPPPPATLGGYRVTGTLGAGGMGVVYRGVQARPQREVAIKVLRGALLTAASVRRFEREAELLARLQHRGIAQVIELGRTDAGETFLVMEYIEGDRLTAWAERRALGREARLSLLIELADAVHHAHLRGIVHRDLKPANVLVTEAGQVKVIDFGVARALDDDAGATLETRVGQLLGTLAYMSPEQVTGPPSAVDARADVYALGVLAYELLGGRLPLDVSTASVAQAARIVAEVEPAPLGRLAPACRGDLEAVVGHALEKDPARRYQSAAALADDLRRFLADQPVQARAPSAAYQLRKLARRHRGLVAGLSVATLVVALGTGVAVVQAIQNRELAVEAGRQSERAEASAELAEAAAQRAESNARQAEEARGDEARRADELERTVGVLDSVLGRTDARGMGERWRADVLDDLAKHWELARLADDDVALRRDDAEALLATVDATELARRALHEALLVPWQTAIREQLDDQPLVRADLLGRLAAAQASLGYLDEAIAARREAVALRERELGSEQRETLASRIALASLLQASGRPEEGWALYEELLGPLTRICGAGDDLTLLCRLGLSGAATARGDVPGAMAILREALDGVEEDLANNRDSASSLVPLIQAMLARHLLVTGALGEAESLQRAALVHFDADPEADPATVARVTGDLAATLQGRGRTAEAVTMLQEVVTQLTREFGRESPQALEMITRLALCQMIAGDPESARPLLAEVEQAQRALLATRQMTAQETFAFVKLLADEGACHHMLGDLEGAERLLSEARELVVTLPQGNPLAPTIDGRLRAARLGLERKAPGRGWAEKAAELGGG